MDAKLTCMCTSVLSKAYVKALDATVEIMDFRTDLALGGGVMINPRVPQVKVNLWAGRVGELKTDIFHEENKLRFSDHT